MKSTTIIIWLLVIGNSIFKLHSQVQKKEIYFNKAIEFRNTNYDSAKFYFEIGIDQPIDKETDSISHGLLLLKYGNYLAIINKNNLYKKAIFYLKESKRFLKKNPRYIIVANNNLAVIFEESKNYIKSLEYLKESLQEAYNTNDSLLIITCEINLNYFYSNCKQYEKCYENISIIRERFRNRLTGLDQGNLLFLEAVYLENKKEEAIAIKRLEEAVKLVNNYNYEEFGKIKLLNDISILKSELLFKQYLKTGDTTFVNKSLEYYKAVLSDTANTLFIQNYSRLYLGLAKISFELMDYDQIRCHVDSALKYDEGRNTEILLELMKLKANYFEKKRIYDSTTYYLKKVINLTELVNYDKNSLDLYRTEFELNSEKLKQHYTNELHLKEKANSRIRMIAIVISSVLVLISLLFILYHLKKQLRSKREFLLGMVKVQEEERSKISKELHDSLGQKLMIAKLESSDSNKRHLEEIIEDVRNISRLLHPIELKRKTFDKLIGNLIERYNLQNKVLFTKDITAIEDIDVGVKINLYRIVQESINNIIKHSNATRARIVLTRSGSKFTLEIMDNGSGFNFKKALSDDSFGLHTMRERAKLIGGNLTINSNEQGTNITLIWKV